MSCVSWYLNGLCQQYLNVLCQLMSDSFYLSADVRFMSYVKWRQIHDHDAADDDIFTWTSWHRPSPSQSPRAPPNDESQDVKLVLTKSVFVSVSVPLGTRSIILVSPALTIVRSRYFNISFAECDELKLTWSTLLISLLWQMLLNKDWSNQRVWHHWTGWQHQSQDSLCCGTPLLSLVHGTQLTMLVDMARPVKLWLSSSENGCHRTEDQNISSELIEMYDDNSPCNLQNERLDNFYSFSRDHFRQILPSQTTRCMPCQCVEQIYSEK